MLDIGDWSLELKAVEGLSKIRNESREEEVEDLGGRG